MIDSTNKYSKARSTTNFRPSTELLDNIWAECVKARACQASEYSRKTRDEGHQLHAHHIIGKSTHALRWDLDNGICLTGGEHKFIAHGDTRRAEIFKDWALTRRKATEKMKIKKYQTGGVDLFGTKEYLKQQLKEFKKGG